MSAERWFFDTNVLVYLFDHGEPEKQSAAARLWQRACDEAVPIISTQVLQEFFVTVTKASKQGLSIEIARQAMSEFKEIASVETVSPDRIEAATRRMQVSGFSFWDSLILETAIETQARFLWTEDLQHGQMFGKLQVVNPF